MAKPKHQRLRPRTENFLQKLPTSTLSLLMPAASLFATVREYANTAMTAAGASKVVIEDRDVCATFRDLSDLLRFTSEAEDTV